MFLCQKEKEKNKSIFFSYQVGGVENDLLNRSLAPIEHSKQVKILTVSPPPLLVIALEAAVRNYRVIKTSVPNLPIPLKVCLEQRRKKFIYDRDNRPPLVDASV